MTAKINVNGLLSSRNIFIVLTVLLVIGIGTYSFFRIREMIGMRAALAENEATAAAFDQEIKKAEAVYVEQNAALGNEQLVFKQRMLTILPSGEQITNLTRFFDDFFARHHRPANPLVAKTIRYDASGDVENSDYQVMPFTVNIESSVENFFTFLRFVEESGSLENGVRLMDIESIQLNFDPSERRADRQPINFTVHLNAYHRS